MRQFFKFMFASMLGFLLVGVLLVVMMFGTIAAIGSAFSLDKKPASVKDNSVLHMTLSGEMTDRGRKDQFDLDLGPFSAMVGIGLNDVLNNLDKAKRDERIKGIFLDLSMVATGQARAKEIRDKILEFKRDSGKPVIAYSDSYGLGTYYLASAADEVYLHPQGDLDFRGMMSEMMFFKGMFRKLDVDIQFIRGSNNKFKSFGEAFTEERMSEANREQMNALVGGIWDHYLEEVSASRGIPKAELNAIAEELRIRSAEDAVKAGLVNAVLYRDEVLAIWKERLGLEEDKKPAMAELRQYTRAHVAKERKDDDKSGRSGSRKPKLAVIYAEGDIIDGKSTEGSIGGTSLSETIREARQDTLVKAIVLRVNSPGGSALASDVIWREVLLAKERVPVVVSMGNVAASGGYYISAAADRIFAEPNTVTGSIGVFGMIPNMQGFFNNKLGITFDGVKTNRYADMLTVSRPLDGDELGMIQSMVDRIYDTFKERVASGRGLTLEQVDEIGQGRVWTGVDAMRLGLVDELGGLEEAIEAAVELAGLDDDHRKVELPRQKDIFQQLMEDLGGQARMWAVSQWLGDDVEMLQRFQQAKVMKGQQGVQARMPFDVIIR